METVFQYKIPFLHPLAVHFPIALILVGTVAVAAWCLWGTSFWHRSSLLLYGFGLIGAVFAYFTGEAMEEHVEGEPIVEELVELHEAMALYTLLVTGLVLVLLIGIFFWRRRQVPAVSVPEVSLAVRGIVLFLAILAAALVAWTGHIGGTMVWGVAA